MSNNKLDGLLKWRSIGPFRGGRVVTVAGDPVDPATFYFGACAGGVWKSSDAGMYWENISDGYFTTAAVGALAIAESDPNVIYAGTGESTIRIDVSTGDGVYKSTDAGKSWQNVGLAETRVISKIRIHPTNPDVVYVAALGNPFGANEARGVFRSTDGGKTWEKVLYQSDKAGAIDLTLDPQNPRILYATIWEAYRNFWNISSGGPDSRIYKSMDGGDNWQDISQNEGLPKGPLGKVAVAVSPAKSGRVWALIEAKKDGLYRSDDDGNKWERVSDNRNLTNRAWYFNHITADPQDPETIYVNNLDFYKSTDGGKTFTQIGTPHGDNHDFWIDPKNSRRMIQGNDGGAKVSLNGGESWSTIYNQPTAQYYRMAVDNQYPYRIYGTQQDNTSISVPSWSENGVILWGDSYVAGTGESGHIAVHPEDPNIVYVGAIGSSPGGGNSLQRYDHRTKQVRLITTWPEAHEGHGAEADKYRFAWTYPILFSPHDPNILYVTGNRVFRTLDEGTSWEIISPDLTRADPETLKASGGPINLDAVGAEVYATIFAFFESSHEPGVFWAGSDDGLIHLSRDGGETWNNVTPKALPERTMIHCIEQSPHDPATVYVAGTRYKLDDDQPYLYKTSDYGQSWEQITTGIADNHFTRVIREDPGRAGLLYCGTEFGLYVSLNQGEQWQSFQLNLPVCPIYDLLLKENDLVAATHGRSFWILDDVTPLHQLSDGMMSETMHLFTPRTTVRPKPDWFGDWFGGAPGKNYEISFGHVSTYYQTKSPEGARERRFLDVGENPPDGVIITYSLKEAPEAASLTLLTADGEVLKTFTSKPKEEEVPDGKKKDEDEEAKKKMLYIPVKAGMNRFIWDRRVTDGTKVKGKDVSASVPQGPQVAPGTYQLQLTIGEQTQTTSFEIIKDPRVETPQPDLEAQFTLLMQIQDKHAAGNAAVNRIRDLQQQIEGWVKRVKGHEKETDITDAAKTLQQKLTASEEVLLKPGLRSEWDIMNHGSRLLSKFSNLTAVVASADFAPTQPSYEVFDEISAQLDDHLAALEGFIATEVAGFNQLIRETGVEALVPIN
ncbi:MAG: glycosyl hydrolase [Chloroflexota bacterium]